MKNASKTVLAVVFGSIAPFSGNAISVTTVGAPPNLPAAAATSPQKTDQSTTITKEKEASPNNSATKNTANNQTKEQKK